MGARRPDGPEQRRAQSATPSGASWDHGTGSKETGARRGNHELRDVQPAPLPHDRHLIVFSPHHINSPRFVDALHDVFVGVNS